MRYIITAKSFVQKASINHKISSVSLELWDYIQSCGFNLKTEFGKVTWAFNPNPQIFCKATRAHAEEQ